MLKLFLVAAGFFLLMGLAVAAGVVYLGYKAKKRVDAVQQAYQHNDLGGMIGAATGQSIKPEPPPNWKPASPQVLAAPSSKVPLQASLRWVEAGHDALRGDYESLMQVDSVTKQAVHIKASQQFPSGDGLDRFLGNQQRSKKPRTIECSRTEFVADLRNSHQLDGYLCREGRDEKKPGTTALGISSKTLMDLKARGQAEINYREDPFQVLFKSFKNAMASGSGASSDAASADLLNKLMSFAPGSQGMETPLLTCKLRRVGDSDVAVPVLINDQPAELPAVHVVCDISDPGHGGDFYVLDDPENPLVLAVFGKSGGHGQVIKIYLEKHKSNETSQLEQELEKNGRAKVYDIYFDFRSAALRPESKKVLDEIAKIMHLHPDWKLRIEGNTDNIGGDAFNLELSKRRAASVQQALVTKYRVASARFDTAGFGASHPIDTNDTMEGRARNRRVELVRE